MKEERDCDRTKSRLNWGCLIKDDLQLHPLFFANLWMHGQWVGGILQCHELRSVEIKFNEIIAIMTGSLKLKFVQLCAISFSRLKAAFFFFFLLLFLENLFVFFSEKLSYSNFPPFYCVKSFDFFQQFRRQNPLKPKLKP